MVSIKVLLAIPYICPISSEFSDGSGIRIIGTVTDIASKSFDIRLQAGDEILKPTHIALDISIDLKDSCGTLNSMVSGKWEDPHYILSVPIRVNQKFEILIKAEPTEYQVFINTRYYCCFPHRMPVECITHFSISGDILVDEISYEEETQAIETPPPSYDEAQARVYASKGYASDHLLQPTPGRPPYPINDHPHFMPVPNVSGHFTYNPYQPQTTTSNPAPLNLASPNFRPVPKSRVKRIMKFALLISLLVAIVFVASIVSSNKHKRH